MDRKARSGELREGVSRGSRKTVDTAALAAGRRRDARTPNGRRIEHCGPRIPRNVGVSDRPCGTHDAEDGARTLLGQS